MDKMQRERQHKTNLAGINQVQLVVGRGDRTRIDHEGTVMERARLLEEEMSAHRATELGLLAFDRLLRLAEERSRHARDIAAFVAAVWNNKPLSLVTLRGLDQDVGDDMLAVLDAFRYARLQLAEHVEGGPRRVARVLNAWSRASV
ncbi:MAG TPA: hypothetical protein VLK85_24770 [Ramlibacter sp.]|nr:hypothetical protein [Ramlibacter sp.]